MLRNLPDIAQEEFPLFDRNYLAKCYLSVRSITVKFDFAVKEIIFAWDEMHGYFVG